MSDQKEFYVGYLPNAPKRFSNRNKQVVVSLLLLIPLLTFVIVSSQKGFTNSQFEFGNLVELEGILYKNPVPILKVKTGSNENGKPIYQSILLINFLKFGADDLLETYEDKIGSSLSQTKVRVRGTLIYYDGVALFELTDQENALLDFGPIDGELHQPINTQLGNVELTGEVVDSKCFFGVMKPGEGKPHKSCAVRCIAGGIPPVLAMKSENGEHNYIILKSSDGSNINHNILPYVANPLKVSGTLIKVDDWLVLETSEKQWAKLPHPDGENPINGTYVHHAGGTICAN